MKFEFSTIIYKRFKLILIAKTSGPTQFFLTKISFSFYVLLFTCDRFGGLGMFILCVANRRTSKQYWAWRAFLCKIINFNWIVSRCDCVSGCEHTYLFADMFAQGNRNDSCAWNVASSPNIDAFAFTKPFWFVWTVLLHEKAMSFDMENI